MATFGRTDDGSSSNSITADQKWVTPATPTGGGVVTKLTCRCWVNNTGSTVAKGVIYSDAAGEPDALLATSDEVAITNNVEGANEFPFSGGAQITVVGSTQYWIGIHFQDPGTDLLFISRDATGTNRRSNADTYSNGPADPFGTPGTGAGILDVFVTYTADATGGGVLLLGVG